MNIPGVNAPAIDFPTDATRTLASLAYSGTFARGRPKRLCSRRRQQRLKDGRGAES